MAANQKGSAILKGVENITKILNGVTSAVNAYKSVSTLIALVLGKDGGLNSVETALQEISQQMQAGFDKIVNAINLQTLQQQWQSSSQELRQMQRVGQDIALQFGSFKGTADDPKAWEIEAFAQNVGFRHWCEVGVPGTDQGPVLTVLARKINDLSTLVGTGLSDIDPSMIDLWDSIIAAAQTANVPGFAGLTRYELMYRLMQGIFATLGTLYYMHETILALYYAQNPANPGNFVSAADLVQQAFGDVDAPGSLWGMFDSKMRSYMESNPDPTQFAPLVEYGTAATTGDSAGDSGGAVPIRFFEPKDEFPVPFFFVYTGKVTLGADSFFAGLQWQTAEYVAQNSTGPVMCPVAYLTGTPITIGKDLVTTAGSPPTVDPELPSIKPTIVYALANQDNPKNKNFPRVQGYAFINTSYSPAPQLAHRDLLPVVTGIQIKVIPNRFVVSLQYKQLDISDPAKPIIGAIPGVDWVDNACTFHNDPNFFALNKWDYWRVNINQLDLRPSGSVEYFPVTNASFCQTGPTTLSGTRLGVIARSAWPVYRASFFQPTGALTKKHIEPPPGWTPPPAVTEA
jgi:hypothetical protein